MSLSNNNIHCRIFLGNLASEKTSKEEIRHIFERYGHIDEVVMRKSFGFVQFNTPEAARDAIKSENGRMIGGIRVDINMADNRDHSKKEDKRKRSPSPGRRDGFVPRGRRSPSPRRGGHPPKRSISPRSSKRPRKSLIQIVYQGVALKGYSAQVETLIGQIGFDVERVLAERRTVAESLDKAASRHVNYVIVLSGTPQNISVSFHNLRRGARPADFYDVTLLQAVELLSKEEGISLRPNTTANNFNQFPNNNQFMGTGMMGTSLMGSSPIPINISGNGPLLPQPLETLIGSGLNQLPNQFQNNAMNSAMNNAMNNNMQQPGGLFSGLAEFVAGGGLGNNFPGNNNSNGMGNTPFSGNANNNMMGQQQQPGGMMSTMLGTMQQQQQQQMQQPFQQPSSFPQQQGNNNFGNDAQANNSFLDPNLLSILVNLQQSNPALIQSLSQVVGTTKETPVVSNTNSLAPNQAVSGLMGGVSGAGMGGGLPGIGNMGVAGNFAANNVPTSNTPANMMFPNTQNQIVDPSLSNQSKQLPFPYNSNNNQTVGMGRGINNPVQQQPQQQVQPVLPIQQQQPLQHLQQQQTHHVQPVQQQQQRSDLASLNANLDKLLTKSASLAAGQTATLFPNQQQQQQQQTNFTPQQQQQQSFTPQQQQQQSNFNQQPQQQSNYNPYTQQQQQQQPQTQMQQQQQQYPQGNQNNNNFSRGAMGSNSIQSTNSNNMGTQPNTNYPTRPPMQQQQQQQQQPQQQQNQLPQQSLQHIQQQQQQRPQQQSIQQRVQQQQQGHHQQQQQGHQQQQQGQQQGRGYHQQQQPQHQQQQQQQHMGGGGGGFGGQAQPTSRQVAAQVVAGFAANMANASGKGMGGGGGGGAGAGGGGNPMFNRGQQNNNNVSLLRNCRMNLYLLLGSAL